jgi:hypothetical protein
VHLHPFLRTSTSWSNYPSRGRFMPGVAATLVRLGFHQSCPVKTLPGDITQPALIVAWEGQGSQVDR